MTFPEIYRPNKVGTLYLPDTEGATSAGKRANLKPASEDSHRTLLILIDGQVDFVHTDGALSVPGAVDDTRRTIEWIYSNASKITHIMSSLDSHVRQQIFYPTWWENDKGDNPAAFTLISQEDVAAGVWRPVLEPEWSSQYVSSLAAEGRLVLTIWPYHTMIGTPGHAITPALYEAIVYHASARRYQPQLVSKGTVRKTEHYSVFEAEVKVPDDPMSELNVALADQIAQYDSVYIAGQAKSHCVLESTQSLVSYFEEKWPDAIGKLHLLEDCTSSVVHPQIDFEALATRRYAEFESKGLRLVKTGMGLG